MSHKVTLVHPGASPINQAETSPLPLHLQLPTESQPRRLGSLGPNGVRTAVPGSRKRFTKRAPGGLGRTALRWWPGRAGLRWGREGWLGGEREKGGRGQWAGQGEGGAAAGRAWPGMGGARAGKGGARERGRGSEPGRAGPGRGVPGRGTRSWLGGSEPGSGGGRGRGVEAVESGRREGKWPGWSWPRLQQRENMNKASEVHLEMPVPGGGASPAGNYWPPRSAGKRPETRELATGPRRRPGHSSCCYVPGRPGPAPGLGGAQAPVGNPRPICISIPSPLFQPSCIPSSPPSRVRSDLSLRPNCVLRPSVTPLASHLPVPRLSLPSIKWTVLV